MHPLSKLVVLILAVGMAASSYCAQVCILPQLNAPDCPQHHHSARTNCCDHASSDTALTARMDCGLGAKSADWISLPVQVETISAMRQDVMEVREKYDPLDSAIPYSLRVSPSVLRV